MTEREEWLGLMGTRAAVVLSVIVAVLSLATGLANLTVTSASGPLSEFVPEIVRRTAGFTGTLTGFLMLVSAWELRRGYRIAWYGTVLLFPITAIQGVIQASVYSVPLVVCSVLAIPTVLLNYRRFDRKTSLSTTQLAAIVSLGGTLCYGTIGTYSLREDFGAVDTVTDAFYFTVVTATTVGYGDVTPLTQQARLFGVSLVVLGTASFAVALGSVLGPAIEARFSRALGTMTDTNYELFENHVLVLGYGELTEPLLDELQDTTDFIVVTPDPDKAKRLQDRDIDVLVGNASDEQPLLDAGIDHARAVIVATNNDAEDAFAILTARELNPDIRIVAAATVRENIEKLRLAGADKVLSPAVIGGHLLVRSALQEEDVQHLVDEHIRTDTDE